MSAIWGIGKGKEGYVIKYVSMLMVVSCLMPIYAMQDEFNLEQFHDAVASNNRDVVSIIIRRYPNVVNMPGKNNETALHIAVLRSHEAMIPLLIDTAHADIEATNNAEETPIFYAVYAANDGVLDELINHGAKINIFNKVGLYKHTPLHIAAAVGYVQNVYILLQAGADRAVQSSMGQTALEIAREYHPNNKRLIDMLQNCKS